MKEVSIRKATKKSALSSKKDTERNRNSERDRERMSLLTSVNKYEATRMSLNVGNVSDQKLVKSYVIEPMI